MPIHESIDTSPVSSHSSKTPKISCDTTPVNGPPYVMPPSSTPQPTLLTHPQQSSIITFAKVTSMTFPNNRTISRLVDDISLV